MSSSSAVVPLSAVPSASNLVLAMMQADQKVEGARSTVNAKMNDLATLVMENYQALFVANAALQNQLTAVQAQLKESLAAQQIQAKAFNEYQKEMTTKMAEMQKHIVHLESNLIDHVHDTQGAKPSLMKGTRQVRVQLPPPTHPLEATLSLLGESFNPNNPNRKSQFRTEKIYELLKRYGT